MDLDMFLDIFRIEDQRQEHYEHWRRANHYLARRWEEMYKLPPVLDTIVDANNNVPEIQANLKELVDKANCHFDFPVPDIRITIFTYGENTYEPVWILEHLRDFTAIPYENPKAKLQTRIRLQQKHLTPVYHSLILGMLRSTIDHYFT